MHKQADTGMIKHGARALKRGAHLRHRQIACLRISCWLTCEFEVVAGRVLVFCAFESVDLGQTERSVSCARARRGGSARFVRRAQRGAVGRRDARMEGEQQPAARSCENRVPQPAASAVRRRDFIKARKGRGSPVAVKGSNLRSHT